MGKKVIQNEKSYVEDFIMKNNIRTQKDLDSYIKRRKPTNMVLFFRRKETIENVWHIL